MTDRRFVYDPNLLAQCANWQSPPPPSAEEEQRHQQQDHYPSHHEKAEDDDGNGDDHFFRAACLRLWDQHVRHYYGRDEAAHHHLLKHRPPASTTQQLPSPPAAFLHNVRFVHQHNKQQSSNPHSHTVALNRFAGMYPEEVLPSPPLTAEEEDSDSSRLLLRSSSPEEKEHDQERRGTMRWLSTEQDILRQQQKYWAIGHGSMHHLHPAKKKKKKKPKQDDSSNGDNGNNVQVTYDLYPTHLELPTDEQVENTQPFQTPTLQTDADGALLSIRRNKKYTGKNQKLLPHGQHVGMGDDSRDNDLDFSKYLNWATTDNPDGVPIVNPAFDQGPCGSCWAFSAAGSLEASTARREAHKAYQMYKVAHNNDQEEESGGTPQEEAPPIPNGDGSTATTNTTATATAAVRLDNEAVTFAQGIERQTFGMLNLSVQELIDCDTSADQGCTGGNPLLAFYYLHQYGLTSWDRYPYVGYQDHCHEKRQQRHRVATVQSWGLLSPNHERHMELALRYIGPLAVGIHGSDPSFLLYDSGIFDAPFCKQGANHALLIVGYGQEKEEIPPPPPNDINSTSTLQPTNKTKRRIRKYWIARNSWGTGWGENGMVRIQRGNGKKGTPGVCGIARSPSIALGGILLRDDSFLFQGLRGSNNGEDANTTTSADYAGEPTIVGDDDDTSSDDYESVEQAYKKTSDDANNNAVFSFCRRWGRLQPGCRRICNAVDQHWALALGLLGILIMFVALWPLTMDCRRRRRRRRERKRQRKMSEDAAAAAAVEGSNPIEETSPLKNGNDPRIDYGSNDNTVP